MTSMTNPMDALISLQSAVHNGVPLTGCSTHADIKMFVDRPNGRYRFTFVKMKSSIIIAFVTYVFESPNGDVPRVNIGYAVPPEYRNMGLATEIVKKSVDEVKAEFNRNGIRTFYVEAVISVDNVASKRVAEKLLSQDFEEIIDDVSGEKAFYYCCLVQ